MNIPESTQKFGFITSGLGTHSSRTIMLSELRLLLDACPRIASLDKIQDAILENNILLKNTMSTRKESFRRLRELYGLTENILIFRSLRDLWEQDQESQPLLAQLCANARDPILRASADAVLPIPPGESVNASMISKTINEQFPGRLNSMTLGNIGRHAASSWTQSGHLKGRYEKIRSSASSRPASTAYALFLSYLCGDRGEALFHSYWTKLLDTSLYSLQERAISASQRGWLEYRHAGDITDITFRYLLRDMP